MAAAARAAGYRLLLTAFGLSFCSGSCLADAYLVTPVSLNLSVESPQGEFQLSNRDSHTIRLQTDVVSWNQEQSGNLEQPTSDVVITPHFLSLAPGGEQVVRVELRHPATRTVEQSYRVLFREIVENPAAVSDDKRVALDYSIPLFVAPEVTADPHLDWRLRKLDASTLLLEASNSGSIHAKTTLYSLVPKTGAGPSIDLREGSSWLYVLAGAIRTLRLHSSSLLARGDTLLLTVELDGQRAELPLTLQ